MHPPENTSAGQSPHQKKTQQTAAIRDLWEKVFHQMWKDFRSGKINIKLPDPDSEWANVNNPFPKTK
ncbi:hypothetical protein AAH994_06995 [Weeksellaceae bacterium A-14]|uniref:hypothetical protein n=1 Tax=Daejeonia sp. YH14 TaxID=3439042 RepID=UPI0031E4CCD6